MRIVGKRTRLALVTLLWLSAIVSRGQEAYISHSTPEASSLRTRATNDLADVTRKLAATFAERGFRPMDSRAWIGRCNVQLLPYQGSFQDGTSAVWWGGEFNQPSSTTCLSDTGYYTDIWEIPAAPGDVFDIVFDGGYNTFIGVADAYAPAYYLQQYATTASSSSPGTYIAGWTNFAIPSSWTTGGYGYPGFFEVRVLRTTSQINYLLGAVKRSTSLSACPTGTLCLNAGRFSVSASFIASTSSGRGTAVPLTSDTGYFWFFSSGNVEMVIKVVDGRAVNNHFWVFAGGLTNVDTTITVTDTQTGRVKTYHNPANTAFQPIQDTVAF